MGKKILIGMVSLVFCFASLIGAEEQLKTYYRFDEGSGTALNDISGNGNNATITGGTWVSGVYGYGLSFNGTSDYATTAGGYSFGTGDLSVSFWFKTPNNAQDGALLTEGGPLAGTYGFTFHLVTEQKWWGALPGYINFWLQSPSLTYCIKYPISNNTWYHVVGVRAGGYLKLYVNGDLQDSVAIGTIDLSSTDAAVGLGRSPVPWAGHYFNGTLDETRIYTRALNAGEVSMLYNQLLPPSASPARATDSVPPLRPLSISPRVPPQILPAGQSAR